MNRPNRRPSRISTSRLTLRFEPLEARRLLTTYLVTSADSSGPNTLAAAIALSNADTAEPNIIDFDLTGLNVSTIDLTAPLPTITRAVDIDGTSQPNSSKVELDGIGAGSGTPALVVASTAEFSEVQGLEIDHFGGDGLDIGAANVTVSDDQIGDTLPEGTPSKTGNGGDGLSVQQAAGVTIINVVLSTNRGYGILLESSPGASLNSVTINGTLARGLEPGDGFRIDQSDKVTLTGVTASSSAGIGINVSDSNGLDLTDSTFKVDVGGEIALVDSGGSLGSTISGLSIGNINFQEFGDIGVVGVLASDSPGLILSLDDITGIAGPGLVVDAGSTSSVAAPTIDGVRITNNAGDGIDVNAATRLNLASCTIQSNQGVGISLDNGSTSASIQGTTIGGITGSGLANGGIGLLVKGSDFASISGTSVENGNGFGVELVRSDFAMVANVTASVGIEANFSPNLTLTGLTVEYNPDGIDLNTSTTLSLSDSTIKYQGDIGLIVANGSDDATLTGNTISGNASQDIVVTDSKNFVDND